MNIKNLRKGYENLTMLERLSLADNAIERDDESEIRAIVAASPREQFSQVDYYGLMQEIKSFRFCNLIVRLSYTMQFNYFLQAELLDENRKSLNYARIAAFSYVRTTDVWKAVCEEFGITPYFNREICDLLFSVNLMDENDQMMRTLAFSEDEARQFVEEKIGTAKIQTFEEEKNSIKEALGLPEK